MAKDLAWQGMAKDLCELFCCLLAWACTAGCVLVLLVVDLVVALWVAMVETLVVWCVAPMVVETGKRGLVALAIVVVVVVQGALIAPRMPLVALIATKGMPMVAWA